MESIERLDSAFASLANEYRPRKAVAEQAVRDWRWATSGWFDLRPLYFEQHGFPRGRTVRQSPQREGCVCCGLDASGQIVVERQFNEFGHYETFIDWDKAPIEAAHFDYAPEKKAINLLLAWREEGRTIRSAVAAIHGYTAEEYLWGRHGVTEVRIDRADRKDGKLSALYPLHRVRASYADDGTLKRVERVWPAGGTRTTESVEIMFERRGKRIFRPPA
jgi:hypothetical protein